MANVYATKTGNWSDTTVWNTGTLPTSADDVRANAFTVTINQDITVISIRTDASSPAVAGGGFSNTTAGRNITANIVAGSTNCLTTTASINVVGNVNGGTGNQSFGITSSTVSAVISLIGNCTAGSNNNSGGIILNASGTINITGNANGGTGINPSFSSAGGANGGAGVTINITGNANAISSYGLTASNINMTGIATGGTTSTSYGISTVTGSASGNIIAVGSSSVGGGSGISGGASSTCVISEAVYSNSAPTFGLVKFKNINPKVTVVKANGTSQILVEAGASGDFPIAADVRSGISYASASLTGTLAVPSPSNVRKGVATDATVGTADLTAADMWNALTSTMTTSGSIGERLKTASTVQSNGDQLASYIV
jgi:hypothetical protein